MSTDNNQTDLYRYFDRAGRLLYVGISFNAVARASQHRGEKHWWADVANMTVEHFGSRREALEAETKAIRGERPLWNVQGAIPHGDPRPWPQCHYVGAKRTGFIRKCPDLHLAYEINGSSVWKDLTPEEDVFEVWREWLHDHWEVGGVEGSVGVNWYIIDDSAVCESTGKAAPLLSTPPDFLMHPDLAKLRTWHHWFIDPMRSDEEPFAWWQLPIRNVYNIFNGIEYLRPTYGQFTITLPHDWDVR